MLKACATSNISTSVDGVVTTSLVHEVASPDDRDDSRASCVSPVASQLQNPGSIVTKPDILDTTTARQSPVSSFQAPMPYKANSIATTRARLPLACLNTCSSAPSKRGLSIRTRKTVYLPLSLLGVDTQWTLNEDRERSFSPKAWPVVNRSHHG